MRDGSNQPPKSVVAVAASAGGVEALSEFVRSIPAGFMGAVLVVLHITETGPSLLPRILARATTLDVAQATDELPLRPGLVLVAPPGQHLRVRDGVAVLDRGPRESGHRPSGDALFRSVAEVFGPRGAGVILSGTMDDGAAGLKAIGVSGGLTIAQDPREAAFPGMPFAAIAEAHPKLVCAVRDMGAALNAWTEHLGDADPPAIRGETPAPTHDGAGTSELSGFTCPDCGGTLWRLDSFGAERYRCRVGHAYTTDALLAGKQDAIEAALWAAIVALEERAELSRRVLKRLEGTGRQAQVQRYRDDIEHSEARIATLRGHIKELVRQGSRTIVGENGKEDGPEPTI